MTNKINLLLAEDEPSLGLIIKESLETRNFIVYLAKNGKEALEIFKNTKVEVLVLDVMMPFKDGFTLAKEIRGIDKTIPILFLSAKSQTQDVIEGFKSGGNDYVKKPFSMEELIVRIHALLDRVKQKKTFYQLGNYQFNHIKQTLQLKDSTINLTHREADLLFHLIEKKDETLDRQFILNKLWRNDDFFSARSMDVFISKLRKKLQEDKEIKILNVRGIGYKLIF